MKFFSSLVLFLFTLSSICAQDGLEKNFDQIKSITLPYTDSISYTIPPGSFILNQEQWHSYGFEELETFNSDFEYAIRGKLSMIGERLVLISRTYSEESIHWLCIVDDSFKVRSSLQSAYDNSEGFLAIKSVINENEIQISEWNMYNEPNEKLTVYKFENTEFKEQN